MQHGKERVERCVSGAKAQTSKEEETGSSYLIFIFLIKYT